MGVGVAAGGGGGLPHATSASETIAVSVANDSNLLTTMPPSISAMYFINLIRSYMLFGFIKLISEPFHRVAFGE